MTAVVAYRGVWWWECLPPCPSLGYSDLWCRALTGARRHRAKHQEVAACSPTRPRFSWWPFSSSR